MLYRPKGEEYRELLELLVKFISVLLCQIFTCIDIVQNISKPNEPTCNQYSLYTNV